MDESEWQTRKHRIDIREHLIKNLSMDEDEFDLAPLLGRRGGRSKAIKVFGGLKGLVADINAKVAT